MTETLARERRTALRIVTNAHLFGPSLVALAWRFLRQHGVR